MNKLEVIDIIHIIVNLVKSTFILCIGRYYLLSGGLVCRLFLHPLARHIILTLQAQGSIVNLGWSKRIGAAFRLVRGALITSMRPEPKTAITP